MIAEWFQNEKLKEWHAANPDEGPPDKKAKTTPNGGGSTWKDIVTRLA